MKLSRRRFLQSAAAGAMLGPTVFNHALVARSLAAIGNRYLVVVCLDGGNDGVNTVTPITDGSAGLRQAYDAQRFDGNGGLNLPVGSLLPIGADPNSGAELGFHPALKALHNLYDQKGSVAVVQGVGYPDYDLSHEVSMGIWESGNPSGAGLSGGWIGRHLEQGYGPSDIPAVGVEWSLPGDLRQSVTSVLTIKRLQWFGFPYDWEEWQDVAAKRTAFEGLYAQAAGTGLASFDFAGTTGAATLVASEAYPALHDDYEADRSEMSARYGAIDRDLADDFREVAKMIHGVERGVPNVGARYFRLSQGGYDTHAQQGGQDVEGRHGYLLKELADSLEAFYEDLEDMGAASRVLTVVFSEFSRRILQNGNGSDHGSQGPMLLIGGAVKGGIYGNHPNIDPAALNPDGNTPYSQDPADSFRSVDLRDVYGSTLKQWAGMAHGDILSHVLALDSGPSGEYWTTENFDLDLFVP